MTITVRQFIISGVLVALAASAQTFFAVSLLH
jgi:hypothetical protein